MKRLDKKVLLKSVVRTAVDGCFLPGTMMGTELMFLWLVKMKREVSLLGLTLLSMAFASTDFIANSSSVNSSTRSEQEQ